MLGYAFQASQYASFGCAIVSDTTPTRLVIATRQSRLALWQAHHVKGLLQALYPACNVELLSMSTRGDEVLDRSLSLIGGKGLFVKELEVALQDGRADLAVHSAKDVPMALPSGFAIAAIPMREDPRDAFISNRYATPSALPDGAVVGTASLRREAQLRERFPKLRFVELRGNIDTRLAKLDAGECDAAVLAVAGLVRLGLKARIRSELSIDASLPAPGQGALAIEVATANPRIAQWISRLEDETSALCVRAERAVSLGLGGSCQIPLGAHATRAGDRLRIAGLVAAPDGRQVVRAMREGPASAPEALGEALAMDLRKGGATAILDALAAAS